MLNHWEWIKKKETVQVFGLHRLGLFGFVKV